MKRTPLRRGKPMRQMGPTSRKWARVRAKVKTQFESLGITRCEFGYENCTGAYALSCAHACKRRYLRKDAEVGAPEHIATVAVCCLACHRILDEVMSADEMREAVMGAIERRTEHF